MTEKAYPLDGIGPRTSPDGAGVNPLLDALEDLRWCPPEEIPLRLNQIAGMIDDYSNRDYISVVIRECLDSDDNLFSWTRESMNEASWLRLKEWVLSFDHTKLDLS